MNRAPRLWTCSRTSGRVSVASTTAPSRRAVATACSPATPPPMTKTFAGRTVPAAVVSIGKYRGSRLAAMRTALYPAMLAIEERVSIDCARVIRGIRSIANAVTPRSASFAIASGCRDGTSWPARSAPGRIMSVSWRPTSMVERGGLHFQHEVRGPQHRDRAVFHPCAGCSIVIVGEEGGIARSALHHHGHPRFRQLGARFGDQGDPPLPLENLPHHRDVHRFSDPPCTDSESGYPFSF